VSMLSSEGVWFRPSRQNMDQASEAVAGQARFVHGLGDHLTLVRTFNCFEEEGRSSPEWCKENFLHFRALRQARDIRNQLCDALEKVSEAPLRDGAAGAGGRGRDRDRESSRPTKASEKATLQAMCAGFYMQSARMCSAGGGWLIVGENVLVKCEASSVLADSCSEWVVYTDLVGSTVAHCMMRTVSAVEHEWLRPHLPKLNEVDMKRLVGEESLTRRKVVEEEDPQKQAEQKEVKVSSAKDRFLARKQQQQAAGGKK